MKAVNEQTGAVYETKTVKRDSNRVDAYVICNDLDGNSFSVSFSKHATKHAARHYAETMARAMADNGA